MNVFPVCGKKLTTTLLDGISRCSFCGLVFDSNVFNQLLSAAWQIRKHNLNEKQIKEKINLSSNLLRFVFYFVSVLGYSHDEFKLLLDEFRTDRIA